MSERKEAQPLVEAKIAPGLPVYVRAAAADSNNGELIYLDMTGPHASIQASLALLRQYKRYNSLWDASVKIVARRQIVMRKTLPTKQVNVVVVHVQAIPGKLQAEPGYAYIIDTKNIDFYAKDEYGNAKRPEIFMPVVSAFLPFPVRKEWETELWDLAVNRRLINHLYRWNTKNMRVFKVNRTEDRWIALYKALIPDKAQF
jgi:hypothetical protein